MKTFLAVFAVLTFLAVAPILIGAGAAAYIYLDSTLLDPTNWNQFVRLLTVFWVVFVYVFVPLVVHHG